VLDHILVAVDRSDHAASALDAAKDLAKVAGGTVRVVHVREGLSGYGRGAPEPEGAFDEAQQYVDAVVADLRSAGIDASGEVRVAAAGHVSTAILEEASDSGATVIVVASRGLTDLKDILLGGTTHKLLHRSNLPVVVVR